MRRSHLIQSRLILGLAAATLAVTSPSIANAASTPTKTSVTPKVAITRCSGWQPVSGGVWVRKCIQDTDGFVRVYTYIWNRSSSVNRTVWDYKYIQDTRPPNARTTFVGRCVITVPRNQVRVCSPGFRPDTWHPKRAVDRIRVLPSPFFLTRYSPVIP